MNTNNREMTEKETDKKGRLRKGVWQKVVMAILTLVGGSGFVIAAILFCFACDIGAYTSTRESVMKDVNETLQDRYSIWALSKRVNSSGDNVDYYIGEIDKTNLHLGVLVSDRSDLAQDDNLDKCFYDTSKYVVNNFDENFKTRIVSGDVHVFQTYLNKQSVVNFNMNSFWGYAYIDQCRSYDMTLTVDKIYYDWMTNQIYISAGGMLFPYEGGAYYEATDGVVLHEDGLENATETTVNNGENDFEGATEVSQVIYGNVELSELINPKTYAWYTDSGNVYFEDYSMRIPIRDISVIGEFDIDEPRSQIGENRILEMSAGAITIEVDGSEWGILADKVEEGSIVNKENAPDTNGKYYYVVSYLNNPLVTKDGNEWISRDLFVQAEKWYGTAYDNRYLIIFYVVIFGVVAVAALIYWLVLLVKGIVLVLGKLKLIWRLVLVTVLLTTASCICATGLYMSDCDEIGSLFILLILFCIFFVYPVVFYIGIQFKRLTAGCEELANGNLDTKLDTRFMLWDMKRQAENLNRIGDSIALAVDEQMKSERMKTELITNVSHDIKTPLTSIINYTYLLQQENIDNETATGYIEIISRQSEKLKNLIVDLIEASKASTGNLELNMDTCDVKMALQQIAGEYEEKLKEKKIELVLDVTEAEEQNTTILADGRYLFRIFDNLLVNIMKYSTENTRAYIDLKAEQDDVVITFKNTSKEPLTGKGEEFLERFFRGDTSRNTDGNGLGLAIVKSLVELMQGSIQVYVDGDLFKVQIRFPLELGTTEQSL